ncbi:Uncharacterised protein [Mycobacteroides abscessus subsp. abscessus]|nr:Uncharacterised protein [Mycobacteroides abscessus subsp. abscessus]
MVWPVEYPHTAGVFEAHVLALALAVWLLYAILRFNWWCVRGMSDARDCGRIEPAAMSAVVAVGNAVLAYLWGWPPGWGAASQTRLTTVWEALAVCEQLTTGALVAVHIAAMAVMAAFATYFALMFHRTAGTPKPATIGMNR